MKLELQQGSRSRVLMGLLLVVMIIYVGRLFYLQVIRHGHYVAQADVEQLKSRVIPAKRGLIYAMDHNTPVPLVMNQVVYTVFADPQIIRNDAAVIKVLNEVAGGNLRGNVQELLARKDSRYQIIATKLSHTQAEKLKEKSLLGIGFHEEVQRVYPEEGLAGQALGFVNAEGKGNYGVEAALDARLRGVDGQLRTVTDVRDVPLTIGDQNVHIPARDGENIVLSIDRNIQSHVEEALARGLKSAGATEGSVLVMNPNNGQVLAMANYPSYDPAQFAKVQDPALFNNAIISGPYEPASVIKTFAMATGIDKGVITPNSTYNNTDSIRVYDATIRNASLGITGTRTMQEVLDYSLNTGTVTVAQRLGDGANINRQARDIMYEYFYNRFGLGQRTGIELANESAGLVVSPEVTEGNAVRYSNMTFGQGLDVTMLQVATGFSAVINGGDYYQPTVIAGTYDKNSSSIKKQEAKLVHHQIISGSTSATMREMLRKTRQVSGSYVRGNPDKSGYTIGGKTGTAETVKNGVYVKSETVGTYLGYGGADSPEYVIMVRVAAPNRTIEGGMHASPIFTDISNWMIEYNSIPPKG